MAQLTASQQVLQQQAAQNAAAAEQEKWEVAQLWFRGYTVRAIAEVLGRGINYILRAIQEFRSDILTWHKDSLDKLAAERIEAFRRIQHAAWQAQQEFPKQVSQLFGVILRAEENIGKIQGVLTDRAQSIVDVTHHIKLYDFTDRFPELRPQVLPPIEAAVQEIQPEGQVVVIDGELYEMPS